MQLRALLICAALAAISCDDGGLEPVERCNDEARTPTMCTGSGDPLCQCNTCYLDSDGLVMCALSLVQAPATCLPDGSDWQSCGCSAAQPREVCLETCGGMRCDAACDGDSVLECAQRCDEFFDQQLERTGGVEPTEECGLAIARIATCLDGFACSEASLCEGYRDWDSQEALYLSACGEI